MPIKEIHGNILDDDADVIVIPVNCVGVMGAGLAKQCANRFPYVEVTYKVSCHYNQVKLGRIEWVLDTDGIHMFLLFPTKYHWKDKTKLEWIKDGLRNFSDNMRLSDVQSVAIPALGCGLGGLDWKDVRPLLYALDQPDIEVRIYPPW